MTEDQNNIIRFRATDNHKYLGKVFEKYIPLVFGIGLKYFKSSEKAEDLVQDIYEIISQKLKTHEVENFKSWLHVVTKNRCLEKLRQQTRLIPKQKEAQIMYSGQVFHPDNIKDENLFIKLQDCMDKLEEFQKLCVENFYFKKMTYQTIAEKCNLEWNKVRSYIQNGRRMLKNCIEKSNE